MVRENKQGGTYIDGDIAISSEETIMKTSKPNPFNKREEKDNKKAFAKTERCVKPVAKDTNKTRRKMVKPTSGKQ